MNLWTLVKSGRTLGAIYHIGRHRYIIPMIKQHNVTSLLDAYHREKCQKTHMENEFTSFLPITVVFKLVFMRIV